MIHKIKFKILIVKYSVKGNVIFHIFHLFVVKDMIRLEVGQIIILFSKNKLKELLAMIFRSGKSLFRRKNFGD